METDARSTILGRIREAIGTGPPAEASREWTAVPRDDRDGLNHGDDRRASSLSGTERKDLFTKRLQDYDAQVFESSAGELSGSIAQMLAARGHRRILVPHGFPPDVLPPGFEFVPEFGLSHAAMNGCDGVLTQSTLAIAETGTIVLQTVAGQGRRAASLVPDYHLCLVEASRIVATVPEAIARLQATAHLPTTFISGPSATADIEMTRIKGVHGPRFLDVIVVASGSV